MRQGLYTYRFHVRVALLCLANVAFFGSQLAMALPCKAIYSRIKLSPSQEEKFLHAFDRATQLLSGAVLPKEVQYKKARGETSFYKTGQGISLDKAVLKSDDTVPTFIHEFAHQVLELNSASYHPLKSPLREGKNHSVSKELKNVLSGAEELFADLLATASFGNAKAMYLDLLSTANTMQEKRQAKLRDNSKIITAQQLEGAGSKIYLDPHYRLSIARSKIWQRHLKNASDKKQTQIFTALMKTLQENWSYETREIEKHSDFKYIQKLNNAFYMHFRSILNSRN